MISRPVAALMTCGVLLAGCGNDVDDSPTTPPPASTATAPASSPEKGAATRSAAKRLSEHDFKLLVAFERRQDKLLGSASPTDITAFEKACAKLAGGRDIAKMNAVICAPSADFARASTALPTLSSDCGADMACYADTMRQLKRPIDEILVADRAFRRKLRGFKLSSSCRKVLIGAEQHAEFKRFSAKLGKVISAFERQDEAAIQRSLGDLGRSQFSTSGPRLEQACARDAS